MRLARAAALGCAALWAGGVALGVTLLPYAALCTLLALFAAAAAGGAPGEVVEVLATYSWIHEPAQPQPSVPAAGVLLLVAGLVALLPDGRENALP
ncbi:hypothetical protein [Spirilliplanes yamanashiensis]|uniref:Uncharacterized protein n=1 Tax=Spirilliplanes yamanashiensis TaxID=42233 RepID=A0A8J3Y4T3_9ACTN|nr:hypothetical protein [Spirilliplanes yamanashiensis]MDP9819792.1 apolipoprotein N-acyltransferase [Spirilliplanes yamanashiensis]GIJ01388.1 hypothetical protein Sya03_07400 [Spirilliplanes yamanashiensis]